MSAGVLDGIKVLDFGQYIAGPFAPMLGEQTTEVLLEIGYTKAQIDDFIAKKLVVQADPGEK